MSEDRLVVGLNRGSVLTYGLVLAALVAGVAVLIWREKSFSMETALMFAILAAVVHFAGAELRTALKTRYCLAADERGIAVGCWRREVRIPWAMVRRVTCAGSSWNRKGVHSLFIHLREGVRPGLAALDGGSAPDAGRFVKVRGVFIEGDPHAIRDGLAALLERYGEPEAEGPQL